MLLIDTNVLIGATREDAGHHALCRLWLDEVYRAKIPFGFTELVGAGFLRILTNPEIYTNPSTIAEADAALHDITSRREFMWLNAGHDHWAIFRKISEPTGVKGNLVNDAWLAAIAIEANHQLVTLDRDFARFPGLNWRNLRDGN